MMWRPLRRVKLALQCRGADDVEANAVGAVKLYQRAVEKAHDGMAGSLAPLLRRDRGAARNAARALQLLEVMVDVGSLLTNGRQD